MYNHGYYTQDEYNRFRAVCILGYNSTQCMKIRDQMDEFLVSTRTSYYNIYSTCYGAPTQSNT